ncbi:MAG: tetratricopeptide repeat protein [Desulfuromonadaceae bacterium]
MQQPRPYPTILLYALILSIFFISFTFPISDGDCFWHLATGRWIFENLALPASDPLSFTVTDHNPWRPESNQIPFLLKQYWLGQLALYGAWKAAGSAGIVLLRAVVYTAILLFLCIWMRRTCRGIAPFVLVVLTGFLLREIPNERPQLFSFLLMPLTLYLLERIFGREEGEAKNNAALIALPLVMLVWANTHGSYLLGVVLMSCYLVAHLLSCLRTGHRPDRRLLSSFFAAGAISCLNPNGVSAWNVFFSSRTGYSAGIYEYLTPWQAAIQLNGWYPAYWIGILLAAAGFLRCRSTVKPVHLLVMTALIALSLTGLRYLIFPLLAAPLFVRYLPEIPVNIRTASLTVICCALWLGLSWKGNVFFEFRERWKFPAGAAAFMRQQKPSPNSFSHYDWGGYLALTVPGFKTFTDSRGLVEELTLLYDQAIRGESWRATFERYNINTVIMPGMSETSGNIYPLIDALAASSDWHLVFADDSALMFIRDIPPNKGLIARFAMDKQSVQTHLVRLADRLIKENSNREEYWQTKANALQLLGDRQAAMAAYRRTLQLNPDNIWAQRMLSAGGN